MSSHLLRQILQVSSNQVIAARVEQNGKAPGISEGNQTRFSWKEVYVHDLEIGNLLARHLRPVQPGALLWIEGCRQC